MRYMKVLSLGIVGFAFAATMALGQGNQEAAKLTREGIEASKAKDWDKASLLSERRRSWKGTMPPIWPRRCSSALPFT